MRKSLILVTPLLVSMPMVLLLYVTLDRIFVDSNVEEVDIREIPFDYYSTATEIHPRINRGPQNNVNPKFRNPGEIFL